MSDERAKQAASRCVYCEAGHPEYCDDGCEAEAALRAELARLTEESAAQPKIFQAVTSRKNAELSAELARLTEENAGNKADNKILAEISEILMGYREGKRTELLARTQALTGVEERLESAESTIRELKQAVERINHLATVELNGTERAYYVTNRGDIAAESRAALESLAQKGTR